MGVGAFCPLSYFYTVGLCCSFLIFLYRWEQLITLKDQKNMQLKKVFIEWMLSSLKADHNTAYLHYQNISLMFEMSVRLKKAKLTVPSIWTNSQQQHFMLRGSRHIFTFGTHKIYSVFFIFANSNQKHYCFFLFLFRLDMISKQNGAHWQIKYVGNNTWFSTLYYALQSENCGLHLSIQLPWIYDW